MKKIWSFILCLVISLTMTSVCLASDGADLNKQQQAVVKVFAALNGQNGMEYAGIRQLMSAKLQTELDEKLRQCENKSAPQLRRAARKQVPGLSAVC